MRNDAEFAPGKSAPGALRNPQIPFESTSVATADGARLHVRTYGPADGPTVVLIHGFGCRLEYWNPQINTLAARCRVVVYDQRGLGRSTFGTAPVGPDILGDDLSAVLAATVSTGRRAVLVGHSYGGITIMAWAKRHPGDVERYASAVLLTDTVADRFNANTAILPYVGKLPHVRRPLLVAFERTRTPLPPTMVTWRAFRYLAMSPSAGRAEVDFLVRIFATAPRRTRAAWSASLSRLDVVDGVRNLTVPTTVLVGERDRLTPVAASVRIADLLRENGRLHRFVCIPRVGHCPNIEAPAQFDAALLDLIDMPNAEIAG